MLPHVRRARILILGLGALLLPAAIALAAQTVRTGPALHVRATSVDLSGTVNPGGQPTQATFQFGTTEAYGASTGATDVGTGTSDVPVEHAVTGLRASTTYHYRIAAHSGGTDTVGADRTFTTSAPPRPSISGTGSSSTTSSSAVLSATVNPNGGATTVVFDYGRTTAYGASAAPVNAGSGTGPVTIRRTITGLESRRTYHFRARASNSGGERVGPDRTFTTVRAPAPRAGTIGVIRMEPTAAVVVGRVDPQGASGTAYAEYGTTTRLGTRSAGVAVSGERQRVEIPIGGLTPGVRYHVRAALQTDGGTNHGRRISFVTPALGALLVSPWPVPSGRTATLTGRLRGSGTTLARVILEGRSHPFRSPFAGLGVETTTDGVGNFTMRRAFRRNARVRIRAEINGTVVFGPESRVNVRPKILRNRWRRISGGRVRVTGTISPRGSYTVSVRRGGTVVKRMRVRARGGRTRYRLTFRVRRTGAFAVRAKRRDGSLVSHTTSAKRLRGR